MRARCYIAGPMRARPQFNFPAFMDAATRLRAAGWTVFNPAEMDKLDEASDPVPLDLTLEQQATWTNAVRQRRYAARDMEVIIGRLRGEDGDAIVLLDGWWESTGAFAERAVAKWVGLRILTLGEALSE